jgi:hypothetical protein
MQTIFITAASGNIGSVLIPSLLTRNDIKLVLPTSTTSKLATYKDNPNATVVEGPLTDLPLKYIRGNPVNCRLVISGIEVLKW